jgi:hypothetical protein
VGEHPPVCLQGRRQFSHLQRVTILKFSHAASASQELLAIIRPLFCAKRIIKRLLICSIFQERKRPFFSESFKA